ncbi:MULTISPECIES: hypothetical protein [unclassified Pseudomonas]|jgi:hypothetical protein|uniref:hypothetical protein n=1 Tax=unclassified Pseudomonas TaxID=196821 RepID=UPI000EA8FE89|nr:MULTISPECIES: hypothetical protein [unclassified Pseudomonas]AYF86023.1 hypothetical protein D6Z43_02070 [Pseudomonas sp. DY-1]MDH4656215.1 hypothetical protein [Pseudomonas sp. BN606]MRK19692.1 hypothetical protein [Pseudomonas sp. JG-B]
MLDGLHPIFDPRCHKPRVCTFDALLHVLAFRGKTASFRFLPLPAPKFLVRPRVPPAQSLRPRHGVISSFNDEVHTVHRRWYAELLTKRLGQKGDAP